MVRTYLTNFGYSVYEGSSLYDAMEAAEKAGFESTVYNEFDETVMTYSPIGGWIFGKCKHIRQVHERLIS